MVLFLQSGFKLYHNKEAPQTTAQSNSLPAAGEECVHPRVCPVLSMHNKNVLQTVEVQRFSGNPTYKPCLEEGCPNVLEVLLGTTFINLQGVIYILTGSYYCHTTGLPKISHTKLHQKGSWNVLYCLFAFIKNTKNSSQTEDKQTLFMTWEWITQCYVGN